MDIFWIALAALATAALLTALVTAVRADGLGHRLPPRSHTAWDDPPVADDRW